MKNFVLVILLVLSSSCDPVYNVNINGQKNIILGECGSVKISCKGVTGSTFLFNVTPLKKSISINPVIAIKSLLESNSNIDFYEISIFQDKKDITESKYTIVKPKETLSIKFVCNQPKGREILIPPGDYLKCKGTNILTDTLRIK